MENRQTQNPIFLFSSSLHALIQKKPLTITCKANLSKRKHLAYFNVAHKEVLKNLLHTMPGRQRAGTNNTAPAQIFLPQRGYITRKEAARDRKRLSTQHTSVPRRKGKRECGLWSCKQQCSWQKSHLCQVCSASTRMQ